MIIFTNLTYLSVVGKESTLNNMAALARTSLKKVFLFKNQDFHRVRILLIDVKQCFSI